MSDPVNHPAHYGGEDNPYECIRVIEAWGLDFCLGNAVKYISRAGKKGDELEDLKKARWYVDRRIGQLEGPAWEVETITLPKPQPTRDPDIIEAWVERAEAIAEARDVFVVERLLPILDEATA